MLKSDTAYTINKDQMERIAQIYLVTGKTEPVDQAQAGIW